MSNWFDNRGDSMHKTKEEMINPLLKHRHTQEKANTESEAST
jgi:hypothetical protein